MEQSEARQEILEKWRSYSSDPMTTMTPGSFYRWLREEHPDLLAFNSEVSKFEQVKRWLEVIAAHGSLPSILKLNTGMNRLGLQETDARALAGDKAAMASLAPDYLMSHLAFSEDPDHPMNAAQRDKFNELRSLFPVLPATMAGSGGVMMGPDYHYDMVRPGVGLFGGNPFSGRPNPFAEV